MNPINAFYFFNVFRIPFRVFKIPFSLSNSAMKWLNWFNIPGWFLVSVGFCCGVWMSSLLSSLGLLHRKGTTSTVCPLTLVMMGGGPGPYVPTPQSVFIFLQKISPPEQTLRPTYKLLILGLLYYDFFFLFKF